VLLEPMVVTALRQCQVLKGLGWADLAVLVVLGLCRAGGLDM